MQKGTGHLGLRVWRLARALIVIWSVGLLLLAITIEARSWLKTDRFYVHIIHPEHDAGWGRQYEVESSSGRVGFAIDTETTSARSLPFLQGTDIPIDGPTFTLNPPTQPMGPGGIVAAGDDLGFSAWHFSTNHTLQGPNPEVPDDAWRTGFTFPVWALAGIALPGAIYAMILLRTFLRAPIRGRGLCVKCGYDLRASGKRCPECGTMRDERIAMPIVTRQIVLASLIVLVTGCVTVVTAGAIVAHRQAPIRAHFRATLDLRAAADAYDTNAMSVALSQGADPDTSEGQALRSAVTEGDATLVNALVAAGANVNMAPDIGLSPLDLAIVGDKLDLVWLLLDAGAKPSPPYLTDQSLTELANGSVDSRILPLLFAHHLDLSMCDKYGNPLLVGAVAYNNPGLVRLLLSWGADAKPAVAYGHKRAGQNALHLLAGNNIADRVDLFRLLIQHGADTNARDAYGQTPLHVAVLAKDTGLIDQLIDVGSDLTIKDDDGHRAADLLSADLWGDYAGKLTPPIEPTSQRLPN